MLVLGVFLEEKIADKTHAMPWVLTTNIQFPSQSTKEVGSLQAVTDCNI
jgi:hypothetical protein